jgi:tRNA-Thr(GGU) m(6)t(6)A37 methyltransferase TsaA
VIPAPWDARSTVSASCCFLAVGAEVGRSIGSRTERDYVHSYVITYATMSSIVVEPIGFVRSPRTVPLDDDWAGVSATITLDAERFTVDALCGLTEFSHVEVVYVFDRVDGTMVETAARHPRGNESWPLVGVFAQRAKGRPNRIGVSVCELVAVDGLEVAVMALDAIDGTPVLDLKPYMAEFAPRGEVRQPAWSHELMAGYW